jgi:hypothetical protein
VGGAKKTAAALTLLAIVLGTAGCGSSGGSSSTGPAATPPSASPGRTPSNTPAPPRRTATTTPAPPAAPRAEPSLEPIIEYGGHPGEEMSFALVYPGPFHRRYGEEAGGREWRRHRSAGERACAGPRHLRLARRLGVPSGEWTTLAEAYADRFALRDRVAAAIGCWEGIAYRR